MLSPERFHESVPKGLDDNYVYRGEVLEEASKSREFRIGLLEACKQDILFWVNTFVFQFNPQHFGDEVGPFITWDFQDDDVRKVLRCLEERKDLRWQKSREMGVSWLTVIVMTWLCLFHERKKGLVISQDADGVDRPDDPDCLFWKIQFILEHLPDWMSRGAFKRKMGFTFPATNSTINGEANTVKAGVGGRASMVLFDEFGQFKDGGEIFSRTADTSYCRVFVFTHKNTESMAYDLCFDVKYAGMESIVTHWTKHPEKNPGLYRYDESSNRVEVIDKNFRYPADFNFTMDSKPEGGPFPGIRSPWYDKECQRRPARAVAMDLDIDPRGASDQFFDGYSIKVLKGTYACAPLWKGNLEYDAVRGQPVKLVKADDGLIHLWCLPKGDGRPPVASYGGGCDLSWGTGATPTCLSLANTRGEKVLEYINAKIGPIEMASLAVALARLFVDGDGIGAKLCWEIQGPGTVFGPKVIELGYTNVFYKRDEDALGKPANPKMIPGWNTSPTAIMKLLSEYRDALKEKRFINRSAVALEECLNFVFTTTSVEYKNKGKADDSALGSRTHHGDIVVADALAYKMIRDLGVQERQVEAEESINVLSLEGRRRLSDDSERRRRAWA